MRCTRAGILLILATVGCAPRAAVTPTNAVPYTHSIDRIINAPPLERTHWGILVADAETGRVLYRHRDRQHFIPASNTKLVVTATALGLLGPDFRYATTLAGARPDAGVIGDLVVRASGDPTMSRRYYPSGSAALDSLALRLRAAGVEHVRGDLVIDASRFDDTRVLGAWEVGDLPWSYATPVGAFAIDEGTFGLVVAPAAVHGAPARVTLLSPAAQPVALDISTDSATGASWEIDPTARYDSVRIEGTVSTRTPPDTSFLAVTDANTFAGRALLAALQRAGIRVDGSLRVEHDARNVPAVEVDLARIESPPLRDIVAGILQPSQNWIAEQLLLTLGSIHGNGGSWAGGLEVERRYLVEQAGVDSLAFSLRDASGLSAQNLLAPDGVVQLLLHARASPWGGDYRAALARPGMRGSTLSSRMTDLEGRVFAKTGTITNVNALSGYLVDATGREIVFSIMTNATGRPSTEVRAAIDAVVQAIASNGGGT